MRYQKLFCSLALAAAALAAPTAFAQTRAGARAPAAPARSQDDDSWPPLSYLRSDYRSVNAVAHVLIRRAEVTGRIGGYENWRVSAEVVEPFKGGLRRGEVVEYFHGAEAGLRREYFNGAKIVFLLAEYDREKKARRYSVLENSTLPHTQDRARKLRAIRRADARRRPRR